MWKSENQLGIPFKYRGHDVSEFIDLRQIYKGSPINRSQRRIAFIPSNREFENSGTQETLNKYYKSL